MNTNDYDIYIKDCIALARSMVIKSEMVINAQNEYVTSITGSEMPEDKRGWPFYLNMMGEYYTTNGLPPVPKAANTGWTAGSDELMLVRSHDGGGVIPFTKESLMEHPFTYLEYRRKGRFYNELIKQYPDQTLLIDRILWPYEGDVESLINAPNNAIVYYEKQYVADNEINLLENIQKRLNRFTARYQNDRYAISDRYYPAAYLMSVYTFLASAIVQERINNQHSWFTHPYHVWAYLGNYYDLHKFEGQLPIQQALWLYNNIDELINFAGGNHVLDKLNEEFAKPHGLLLSEVVYVKDAATLTSTDLASRNVTPSAILQPYNSPVRAGAVNVEISRVVDALIEQGTLNRDNIDVNIERISKFIVNHKHSRINSGIVSADAEITGNNFILDIPKEKMNMWFYLAAVNEIESERSINIYNAQHRLRTGDGRSVIVTASEAAAVLMYCAYVYAGRNLADPEAIRNMPIPSILCREIPIEFESIAQAKLDMLNVIETDVQEEMTPLIDGLVDGLIDPPTPNMEEAAVPYEYQLSTYANFEEYMDVLLQYKLRQAAMIVEERNPIRKAQLINARRNIYKDVLVKLTRYETFGDLLDALELDLSSLDYLEAADLAAELKSVFIDTADVIKGLPSPHREMLEILRMLNAFTTIFVPGVKGIPGTDLVELPSFAAGDEAFTFNIKEYFYDCIWDNKYDGGGANKYNGKHQHDGSIPYDVGGETLRYDGSINHDSVNIYESISETIINV